MANRAQSVYSESQYEPSEVDSQDQAWDDWSNDEEEQQDSTCLFCSSVFPSAHNTFSHIRSTHQFDFQAVKKQHDLDFYKCIRLINYIREQVKKDPNFTVTEFTGEETFWEQDEYLQPVLENDTLLFAFDDLDDDENNQPEATSPKDNHPSQPALTLNQIKPTTELETLLLKRLRDIQETQTSLEGQFEEYKSMVKKTFFDTLADTESTTTTLTHKKANNVAELQDENNYYFNSYSHNDIHEQMLKDRARTEAYRDFIYENKDVFKDKVVLDVGCGTGILSMFAARAGAKQVFSVDNSAIIEKAKLNIEENELSHIITCVRGKVEEIELPVSQVDIIISEWMGYFLLFEAMLDSVLVARDRWLAPNGIMAPSHCRILMAALDEEETRNEKVNFWSDVYGFKMTAMKGSNLREAVVDFIDKTTVVSNIVMLKDLPLQRITIKQLDFVKEFEVEIEKDGVVTAFGGWFDTWFTREGHDIPLDQKTEKVEGETFMSTSCFAMDTHWKQTTFMLEESIHVKKGDKIRGIFKCQKGTENIRELECEIEYFVEGGSKTQSYVLVA